MKIIGYGILSCMRNYKIKGLHRRVFLFCCFFDLFVVVCLYEFASVAPFVSCAKIASRAASAESPDSHRLSRLLVPQVPLAPVAPFVRLRISFDNFCCFLLPCLLHLFRLIVCYALPIISSPHLLCSPQLRHFFVVTGHKSFTR